MTTIAAATTLRLHLDPDILKLVPQNNREVKEFRDVLEETGTIDFHVVVLKLPAENITVEQLLLRISHPEQPSGSRILIPPRLESLGD